jgi:hypothetical protein
MWRNRTWLMVPLVLIAVGALVRAVPVTAASGANLVISNDAWIGLNGQQMEFEDSRSDVYRVCVVGPNQMGAGSTLCYSTQGSMTLMGGSWWKGETYLLEYGANGRRLRTQSTDVPVVSIGSHWCFSDLGDGAGTSC